MLVKIGKASEAFSDERYRPSVEARTICAYCHRGEKVSDQDINYNGPFDEDYDTCEFCGMDTVEVWDEASRL